MSSADRDIRQREIVPPAALAAHRCTVIGVGSIGRQVALQLAAMGAPRIQLIDPDHVAPENLACQGFRELDLAAAKVHATADACHQLHPGIELEVHVQRFQRSQGIGSVVFCCVDSISARRHIWQAVQTRAALFVDGRMAAEVLRVLAVADDVGRKYYPTTLFEPAAAYAGACTARSTIFCANVAAGLMVAQFARFLRGFPVAHDVQLNLLCDELHVPAIA